MTAMIITLAVLATAGWLMVWGAAVTVIREREEKEELWLENIQWQIENEIFREQLWQTLHNAYDEMMRKQMWDHYESERTRAREEVKNGLLRKL